MTNCERNKWAGSHWWAIRQLQDTEKDSVLPITYAVHACIERNRTRGSLYSCLHVSSQNCNPLSLRAFIPRACPLQQEQHTLQSLHTHTHAHDKQVDPFTTSRLSACVLLCLCELTYGMSISGITLIPLSLAYCTTSFTTSWL